MDDKFYCCTSTHKDDKLQMDLMLLSLSITISFQVQIWVVIKLGPAFCIATSSMLEQRAHLQQNVHHLESRYNYLWNTNFSVAITLLYLSFDNTSFSQPTWPQTSCCPFATKSHAKGSNCVKWSWYTTLKINNKRQTNVSAPLVFFPVCE